VQDALGFVYSTTGRRLRECEIVDAKRYRETYEQEREPYVKAIILVGVNEPLKAVQ
jgi:hypothetical protein